MGQLKELLADFERQASEAQAAADRFEGITAATKEGQSIAFEKAANQVSRLIQDLELENVA